MFARFGIVVCILVVVSLSSVGCGRQAAKVRADLLFRQKKYQEAIDVLTPHLKRDPSDAESYFARGTAYARLDQYDEALADFDKVLSLDPQHRMALELRAKCLVDLAKYEEAKIAYTVVIDRGPDEVASYFGRAKCYDALDQHDLAIADLEKALQSDPTDAFSHYLLALLLASSPNDTLRDGKRAVDEAQIAVQLIAADSPQHWQALCCLATAYAECGDFKKAIALQEEGLALAADGKGKQDAERTLERYRGGEPYRRFSDRSVREAAARIDLLFEEKKYQEAIDALTEQLERNPSDADAFLFRGTAYCRLERFEEGLADFEKALKLKPDHTSALKSRAKCLLDLRKYQEAAEAYDRVIRDNPDEAIYHMLRSRCYEALGKFAPAIADLQKSVDLDSSDGFTRFLLAKILVRCPVDEFRDNERGMEEAKIVVGMTSPDSELQGLAIGIVALAHAERGEFEKAVELLEKSQGLLARKEDKERVGEMLEYVRKGEPYPRRGKPSGNSPAEQIEPAAASP
jgi:tetratricopeptide (TPR) repeat protein